MRVNFRTETFPESGSCRPARISINVVLPLPFGPMRPSRSPSDTESEIRSKSRRDPNDLVTSWQLSRSTVDLVADRGGIGIELEQLTGRVHDQFARSERFPGSRPEDGAVGRFAGRDF